MKNFYTTVSFNRVSVEYAALHPSPTAPSSPVTGMTWTDTTVPTNAILKYWNGTGWVDISGSSGADIYVNALSFSSSTGILSATRTGGQSTLTVNLDGRYLTSNQSITLDGDVSGTGNTNINVIANPDIITTKPETSDLDVASYFLYYNVNTDALEKISWGTINEYIDEMIDASSWDLSTAPGSNYTDVTLSNGTTSSVVRFLGTTSEIQVTQPVAGTVQVGLPDDVTIANNLTVTGNLVVNGTETIINTEELKVEDNIITLNSNVTGVPLTNAGIEINRGSSSDTSVIWNESTDRWTFTNDGTTFYNIPITGEYNFYTHPSYTARNIDGSGLQFVQDFTSDATGHVTNIVLGTIPTATTVITGVTRLATNAEATAGTAGVALQPSQIGSFLDTRSYIANITGTSTLTHNLNASAIYVQLYDNATGELIEAGVTKVDANNTTITFDSTAPLSTQVVILKIR